MDHVTCSKEPAGCYHLALYSTEHLSTFQLAVRVYSRSSRQHRFRMRAAKKLRMSYVDRLHQKAGKAGSSGQHVGPLSS